MIAASNSNVAGYVAGNRQDLAFIGDANRIYVLDFVQAGQSNPWTQWDIVAFQQRIKQPIPFPISGAGGPRGGCPLGVLNSLPVGVSNALTYIGNLNGEAVIILLTLEMAGAQVPNVFNLTQLTKSPPPRADSPLAVYTWQKQQSMHIIYIDNQSHVRELYRAGSGSWAMNDLTSLTGFTGIYMPKVGSPLAGYVWENQATEHVIYIAQDNTIREIYYSGQWYGNNLSTLVPEAAPPEGSSPLAGYAAEYENTEHVIYFNRNGNIQELYYSGGWKTGTPLGHYGWRRETWRE